MAETIRTWWPVIAFGLTLVAWIGREGFMYLQRQREAREALDKRLTVQESAHKAHEDICSRRYGEIAREMAQLKETGDNRHSENLGRFDDLRGDVGELRADVREILKAVRE